MNLSRSLQQHADGVLDAADMGLLSIAHWVAAEGVPQASMQGLHELLVVEAAGNPALRAFSLLGPDGRRLVTSLPGAGEEFASGKELVAHHARTPDGTPFLGNPVRSPVTGEWIVTLSRRIDGAGGVLLGVAVATINAKRFADHYADFDVGRDGSILLLRADGIVIARYPWRPEDVGRDVSGFGMASLSVAGGLLGSGEYRSVFDGKERLLGYARSVRYPLIVGAAEDTEEILSAWRSQLLWHVPSLVGLIAILAVLGLWLASLVHHGQAAERKLAVSEATFRLLTEHASDMVTRVDAAGIRRYVSPAAEHMLGYSPQQLVGSRPQDEMAPEDIPGFERVVSELGGLHAFASVTYRARRRDGAYAWLEKKLHAVDDPVTGMPDGYVGVCRDITVRHELEERLKILADTDGLTGLSNRRQFDSALVTEVGRAARERQSIAVCLIDVDNFKKFNDRFGHVAGDTCLRSVAEAISGATLRPGDSTARYGGEEFAIILPDTDRFGAAQVAERVRRSIEGLCITHPDTAAGVVTVSIGFAASVPASCDKGAALKLLETADRALYGSKRSGRNVIGAAEDDPAPPVDAPSG